jgi:hypothetical protein
MAEFEFFEVRILRGRYIVLKKSGFPPSEKIIGNKMAAFEFEVRSAF